MRNDLIPGIVLAALGLSACSGGGDTAPVEPEPAAEPDGILLDSARRPLERAREVEDLTGERKGRLDDALEDAGQ